MLLEPVHMLFIVRFGFLYQGPEIGAMIVFDEMRKLVDNYIVKHGERGEE